MIVLSAVLGLAFFASPLAVSASPYPYQFYQRSTSASSDGCTETLNEAELVGTRLMQYYNATKGGFSSTGTGWTDANSIETIHNLMLGTSNDTWPSLSATCFLCQAALDPDGGPGSEVWENVLTGYNDDAQWFILAMYKVADFKDSQGEDPTPYLDLAAWIYDVVSGQWDDTCNGGVWWQSTQHTYKNAITNELYLSVSTRGYEITGNQTYLDNANKVWEWLLQSGMRNSEGLWNDGLNFTTCENNNATTWSYNQGVLLSGLGALYNITGNSSYLSEAEITLNATIKNLGVNGTLKESCDYPNGTGGNCSGDASLFKGIWTKHLQYYLDYTFADNSTNGTESYTNFLTTNAAGVFHNAMDSGMNVTDDVGTVWFAPNEGGSVFGATPTSSGLDALVAAGKYGACPAW